MMRAMTYSSLLLGPSPLLAFDSEKDKRGSVALGRVLEVALMFWGASPRCPSLPVGRQLFSA